MQNHMCKCNFHMRICLKLVMPVLTIVQWTTINSSTVYIQVLYTTPFLTVMGWGGTNQEKKVNNAMKADRIQEHVL